MYRLYAIIILIFFVCCPAVAETESWFEYISTENGLSQNTVTCIIKDHDGFIWFGSQNGLNRFDGYDFKYYYKDIRDPHSLSDNFIQTLYVDGAEVLWIGTGDGGLNRYEKSTSRFIRHEYNPDNPYSISDNSVWAIHEGHNGSLWIGTFGGGLYHFVPGTGAAYFSENLTTQQGLAANIIYGILSDGSGELYLSTNSRLTRFNPATQSFTNYTTADGLSGNEFYWGAYNKTRNGTMYFGGVNGITYFHPDSLKSSDHNFPVVLTDISVGGHSLTYNQPVHTLKQLDLSYRDNYLTFRFAALDYIAPSKNLYYYKLEGLDEDWIFSDRQRAVSYTNLGSGSYTFRVQAVNSRGHLSTSEAALNLKIPPPFWMTKWFLLLFIILLTVFLYAVYKIRVKTIETQRKILSHKVEKRTQELKTINEEFGLAKKETDNILQNAEEGFFLINREMRIGTQYSRSLVTMMGTSNLAGRSLIDCLKDHVSDETVTNSEEFFELLFNDDIDEETLCELNPINMIEMKFNNSNDGNGSSKFLAFRFKRIRDQENAIIDLFATVRDISDQTRLARQLEKSELDQKRKMELMFSILHVEPAMFSEFMISVENELEQINVALSAPIDDCKLETMYRSAHSIKGNASLIDLRILVKHAHVFEDQLLEIQMSWDRSERALTLLSQAFQTLQASFSELRSLIDQIRNFQTNFRPKRRYENKLLIQSLENLINSTSDELNKRVTFRHEAFDPGSIPYNYRFLTKEILIQLFRNAISHGIEDPNEREKQGKPATGTLSISSVMKNGYFTFSVRDDGRGIQLDKLKQKIINSGKWTDEEVAEWTHEQLQNTIFESGISTQDSSNFISGRGVGMDIIKDRLSQVNGDIEIDQKAGEYCEFTVRLPLNQEKETTS